MIGSLFMDILTHYVSDTTIFKFPIAHLYRLERARQFVGKTPRFSYVQQDIRQLSATDIVKILDDECGMDDLKDRYYVHTHACEFFLLLQLYIKIYCQLSCTPRRAHKSLKIFFRLCSS